MTQNIQPQDNLEMQSNDEQVTSDKEQVTAATIARTTVLALALFNQILSSTGHAIIDLDDDTINTFISLAFTIGASLTAFWKNNSFTKKAIAADKTFKK